MATRNWMNFRTVQITLCKISIKHFKSAIRESTIQNFENLRPRTTLVFFPCFYVYKWWFSAGTRVVSKKFWKNQKIKIFPSPWWSSWKRCTPSVETVSEECFANTTTKVENEDQIRFSLIYLSRNCIRKLIRNFVKNNQVCIAIKWLWID